MAARRPLPLFVLAIAGGAGAMLAPAALAIETGAWASARAFGAGALSFGFLAALVGIATSGRAGWTTARAHLLTLPALYLALPAMLAVPVIRAMPETAFAAAYLDMIACLTTTGGNLLAPEAALPAPVAFWRALVAWLGGLMIWVGALAVLAPLDLGGFEVLGGAGTGRGQRTPVGAPAGGARIASHLRRLMPVYAGLTLVLWVLLAAAGGGGMSSLVAAMSTLSTSGILMETATVPGGRPGEAAVLIFFVVALTRVVHGQDGRPGWRALGADRELRTGLAIVAAASAVLVLGHWSAGGSAMAGGGDALRALWAIVFTSLSFLVTAGFVSADWPSALVWTGVTFNAVVLAGLVQIGGGIATTAGGVKLLRIYVLWRHGRREMARLIHPSSVGPLGWAGVSIARRGVYRAWLVFMLFALSIAVVTAALALVGLDLEMAVLSAVASLTTTGPLVGIVEEGGMAALGPTAHWIMAGAMILGRLETLALIALFDPALWRG